MLRARGERIKYWFLLKVVMTEACLQESLLQTPFVGQNLALGIMVGGYACIFYGD